MYNQEPAWAHGGICLKVFDLLNRLLSLTTGSGLLTGSLD